MTSEAGTFNYPIVLRLQGELAVVVGAGVVGQRKVARLLQAGARVRLVDPCLASSPHSADGVESCGRIFQSTDLQGAKLVFACTDSDAVNQQVAEAARCQQLLCCRADRGDESDFVLPAVLEKGRLQLSISTSGASPALAAEFRDRLAGKIPDWWSFSLELAAALRRKWLTEQIDDKYNQQVLRNFLIERLLPLCEDGKLLEINELLTNEFGDDYSLESLQLQLPEGIL